MIGGNTTTGTAGTTVSKSIVSVALLTFPARSVAVALTVNAPSVSELTSTL